MKHLEVIIKSLSFIFGVLFISIIIWNQFLSTRSDIDIMFITFSEIKLYFKKF